MHEAHTTLLEDVGRRQDEVSTESSAHREDLAALKDNVDKLHGEGARASIKLEEQQYILESIKQKIELVKTKLDIDASPDEIEKSENFTTALAITSNLVSLVLSGTTLASAYTMIRQAQEISSTARRFGTHITPRESLTNQPQVNPYGLAKQEEESINRDNSVTTESSNSVAPSRSPVIPNPPIYTEDQSVTRAHENAISKPQRPCSVKNIIAPTRGNLTVTEADLQSWLEGRYPWAKDFEISVR